MIPREYRAKEKLFSTHRDLRKGYGVLNSAVNEFRSIKTISDIFPCLKLYPYNVAIKIIDKYIKEHPEEEHWEYMRYFSGRKNDLGGIFKSIKVSTKGRFCWVYSNRLMFSNGTTKTIDKDNYRCLTVMKNTWLTHRAVASTFIPIPDGVDPMVLETNHKFGNKINNNVSGLEWCTSEENVAHAHNLGLARTTSGNGKKVLMTVVADNGLTGNRYVTVLGKKTEELGFNTSLIYKAMNKGSLAHGCRVEFISKEKRLSNIRPIKELADAYQKRPKDFNTDIVTIKGTIQVGEFKGYEFILRGGEDFDKYNMDASNVHRALKSKKSVAYGCLWEKVSLRDNLHLPRKIIQPVVDSLLNQDKRPNEVFKGVFTAGPFIGEQVVFKWDTSIGLNKELINESVNRRTIRYGCLWENATLDTPETTELNTKYFALLKSNPGYFNPITQPLLCEITLGELKGTIFSITGRSEAENYSLKTNKVLVKLRSKDTVISKGCVIRVCDLKTAYANIPDDEMKEKIKVFLSSYG